MKFNVPTKLCFLRIIFAIVIIILLLFPFYRFDIAFPQILYKNILIDLRYIIAGIIFIFASITDYFDGRIARKRKEVTNFGKMIDAIADKILVNGIDINDYDTTEYRKMIACVFQEVNLYPFNFCNSRFYITIYSCYYYCKRYNSRCYKIMCC